MDTHYAIQLHNAYRAGRHYDLRIVMDGVAKSWAVRHWPKYTHEKRLAIKQPDHPVEYMDWSGVIPKGAYGGGTVKLWKSGKTPLEQHNGVLHFQVQGSPYVLIHQNGERWLLEKL